MTYCYCETSRTSTEMEIIFDTHMRKVEMVVNCPKLKTSKHLIPQMKNTNPLKHTINPRGPEV